MDPDSGYTLELPLSQNRRRPQGAHLLQSGFQQDQKKIGELQPATISSRPTTLPSPSWHRQAVASCEINLRPSLAARTARDRRTLPLLRYRGHTRAETGLGLLARLLDAEPRDIEGRQEEQGQQSHDE